jgi:hypothetical protein
MMKSCRQAAVDLQSLRAAIGRSAILVGSCTLDAQLADWERTRRSPDVDAVVLAWIAGHAGGRKRAPL